MNAKKVSKWYMAGTEGTGKYLVLVQGSLGRVGYRDLGCGQFRVRVEPVEMAAQTVLAPFFAGWKQPDGQQIRFSRVVAGDEALKAAVGQTILAMAKANHLKTNPKAPEWAKELVAQAVAETEAAAKAIEAAKKVPAKKATKPKAPAKKAAPKKPAAKKPTAKKAPTKKLTKKAA